MASDLRETIPTFGKPANAERPGEVNLTNWSALTQMNFARSGLEVLVIALVAAAVIGGLELAVRAFDVKAYISRGRSTSERRSSPNSTSSGPTCG